MFCFKFMQTYKNMCVYWGVGVGWVGARVWMMSVRGWVMGVRACVNDIFI